MRDYVYFVRPIGREGPIKIGFSSVPKERLEALLKWSPLELEFMTMTLGGFPQERMLHEMFAEARLHSEWFSPTVELLALIERVRGGASLSDLLTLDYEPRRPKGIVNDFDANVLRTRDHYRHAVESVFVALSQDRGAELYPPREVTALLNDWPRHPTPAQFAFLDSVLARPGEFAKTAAEIWSLSEAARAA